MRDAMQALNLANERRLHVSTARRELAAMRPDEARNHLAGIIRAPGDSPLASDQTARLLDALPGIGPSTVRILLLHAGIRDGRIHVGALSPLQKRNLADALMLPRPDLRALRPQRARAPRDRSAVIYRGERVELIVEERDTLREQVATLRNIIRELRAT